MDTTFVDNTTTITADWLNAVNTTIYDALAAATTVEEVKTALGIDATFTAADETKLEGIEALADVTDATNVNAAGAVMESDVTAKGQIFVATASGTLTALAVGSDDAVLTADAAEASGVKWSAGSTGYSYFSADLFSG